MSTSHHEIDSETAMLALMNIVDSASLLAEFQHIPIIELQVIQKVSFETAFVPNDLVMNEARELPYEFSDAAFICDFSEAHSNSPEMLAQI